MPHPLDESCLIQSSWPWLHHNVLLAPVFLPHSPVSPPSHFIVTIYLLFAIYLLLKYTHKFPFSMVYYSLLLLFLLILKCIYSYLCKVPDKCSFMQLTHIPAKSEPLNSSYVEILEPLLCARGTHICPEICMDYNTTQTDIPREEETRDKGLHWREI